MEPPFDKSDGVTATISGYTGGEKVNPTYKQVSSGRTGHYEAIRIHYDPEKVSYELLLNIFWRNVNPTDGGGQFCDRGPQYRTAIFYHTEEQRRLAEESKAKLEKSGQLSKSIVTPILPASTFYEAEEYHQDYYKKNPVHYRRYRMGCGRDRVLEKLWGKSDH
jgi:methionine-S-sulfoxide reductase